MGNRARENNDTVNPAQPLSQIRNPLAEHLDAVPQIFALLLIRFFKAVQTAENRYAHITSAYVESQWHEGFRKNAFSTIASRKV